MLIQIKGSCRRCMHVHVCKGVSYSIGHWRSWITLKKINEILKKAPWSMLNFLYLLPLIFKWNEAYIKGVLQDERIVYCLCQRNLSSHRIVRVNIILHLISFRFCLHVIIRRYSSYKGRERLRQKKFFNHRSYIHGIFWDIPKQH